MALDELNSITWAATEKGIIHSELKLFSDKQVIQQHHLDELLEANKLCDSSWAVSSSKQAREQLDMLSARLAMMEEHGLEMQETISTWPARLDSVSIHVDNMH